MVSSSFKSYVEIGGRSPVYVPSALRLDAFRELFDPSHRSFQDFGANVVNSLQVSIPAALFTVLLSTLGAYAVARLRFRGKELLVNGILLIYLFPGVLLIIPLFAMLSQLGTRLGFEVRDNLFDYPELQAELADPESRSGRVLAAYRRLLQVRGGQRAFHPASSQRVLFLDPAVFTLKLGAEGESDPVLCMVNVSADLQILSLDLKEHRLPLVPAWEDLISGQRFRLSGSSLHINLSGYQSMWLTPLKTQSDKHKGHEV
jgi:hypothetical protein